jgi:hypothetical protein
MVKALAIEQPQEEWVTGMRYRIYANSTSITG